MALSVSSEKLQKESSRIFQMFVPKFSIGDFLRWGNGRGGMYTREMGTFCPFGVFFSLVLQYLLLQNWPFSFKT